jgi:tetratricopeptide (TPR) repeat protein
MRATVLRDPALGKMAGRFVWLEIDTEKGGNAGFLERFPIEVWPTFLVIDPATERPVLRWQGTATAADLGSILIDGERALKGAPGESADALLAQADRENGAGRTAEAVLLWEKALAAGGPSWPRRERALESLVSGLLVTGASERCAGKAAEAAPGMARGQSFANVVAMGLTCANDADAPWAKGAVARLEPLAAEAVKLSGVLADDRAGLYEQLVLARRKAGDEEGARARAEEWWAFLVAERASGKSADARTMLDSWIVGAALTLHDPARAVPLLQASEVAAPTDYNPPYRLAVLHFEAKNLDQALKASDRALRLAYGPRKVRVLAQRATILEAKGDPAGARAALQEAVAHAMTLPKAQQNPRLVERLEARIAKLPAEQGRAP